MEQYEVIIIGAGPGGLACAEILAKEGKSVLVLEKNSVVGPKTCAGGLTSKDIGLGLPNHLGKNFKKVVFHTPHRTTNVESKKPFISVIDRKKLGQWMLKKARKAGAIIRTNSFVKEIKKKQIIVGEVPISYKYLVGADGAASIVREYVGLKTSSRDVAVQWKIPKKYKDLEIYFDSQLFASGYAWIFPHKTFTAIGACVDPRFLSPKKLHKNFDAWLKKMNINTTKGTFEQAAINYDYQGHKFGNIYLVGDAAGFSSGLTGEGIYFAIATGQDTAKLILNKKYKPKQIKEILQTKKIHETILKSLEYGKPFRALEYEMILLLLKNKFVGKKFIEYFS